MSDVYFPNGVVKYVRREREHSYRGRVEILDNGWVKLRERDDRLTLPPHVVHYVARAEDGTT